jgi:hypothetical protein
VVVAQIRWIAWSMLNPHSQTVWSALPLAKVRPSGLNATVLTSAQERGRSGRGPGCAGQGGVVLVLAID